MLTISKAVYFLGIKAYAAVLGLAALFHPKAKLWVKGRKGWQAALNEVLTQQKANWIWLHAASLGEFEQGRPLLEAIRREYPEKKILLSFFSPSGYELRKNYQGADYVCYLPLDSPHAARIWLDLLQPDMVFFVKYEFWYYYLKEIKKRKIPCYLVSGVFRPNQLFFKPWGALFREMLEAFTILFIQNQASQKLLKRIGFENTLIAGDTRLDRVLAIRAQKKNYLEIETFLGNAPVFVVGSSWAADELHYLPFVKDYLIPKGWKVIIAPHEVGESKIKQLEQRLEGVNFYRYSKLDALIPQANLLVIDNIGMLSSLYAYADVAYVGGGFGKGIHNILEAAVYEIPVLFGPKHKKFAEAQELLKLGVAFEICKQADLYTIFENLNQQEIAAAARCYIEQSKDATSIILKAIKPYFGDQNV